MKPLLLLALMFVSFISDAQIKRYSFKAAANFPIIPSVVSKVNLEPSQLTPGMPFSTEKITIEETFDEKAGFNFGGQLDFSVDNKIFITTGLSVSYLRFRQINTLIDFTSQGYTYKLTELAEGDYLTGSPVGTVISDSPGSSFFKTDEKLGETTTLYLQSPVLAGVSLFKNRLMISAGATFSFLVNATTYSYKIYQDETLLSIQLMKEQSYDRFTQLLVSATVQATYLVTRQIGINFNANAYLSPVYSASDQSKKAKYNVLSLGLSYSINK